MNKILEAMNKLDCDIADAMVRFLGDEKLYLSCLEALVKDESFDKLKTALEINDVEQAFAEAHTLKGVLANMSITPMSKTIVSIVEPLRAGNADGLMPACDELFRQKNELLKILNDNK